MRTYVCFYKDKRVTVEAETSANAKLKAAAMLKARKTYDVTVVLADKPISTASI
jgi:spermidine/putrescine-binding protein